MLWGVCGPYTQTRIDVLRGHDSTALRYPGPLLARSPPSVIGDTVLLRADLRWSFSPADVDA